MKSWLKKITFIITLLAVLTGGVLLPFSKVKAEDPTPLHIISQVTEKDPSGDKFRFNVSMVKDDPDIRLVYLSVVQDPAGTKINIIDKTPVVFNTSPNQFLTNYVIEKGYTYSTFLEYKYLSGPKQGQIVYSGSYLTTISGAGETSGTDTTTNGTVSGGPSALPKCWLGPASGIDLGGCLAQGVYYALFVPTSFIFSLTGQLLDWSMAYTTDSNSYSGSSAGFVEKGWKITRDIANIFFIFVLLYTAIGTILGLHSVNAKKTVGMVILIALLLNFSLLFTRIIVDASNILGNVFYNNIGTTDTSNVSNPWIQENIKNVSVAIVSKFNPQTIFQDAGALKLNTPSGIESPGGIDGAPAPGQFAIVSILMAIINLVGIWVFLTVAFLFLGRVIGLWIAMIFAPIAFVSYILPDGAGKILGEMHHSKWWDSLLKQAFVVPIFLFFMYLVLTFMSTNFFKDAFGAKTTTQTILGVVVPLLLIAMLLTKARKIAVDMSGEIGKMATTVGTTITGAAVGLTTGGIALVGQRFIGSYAKSKDTEDRRDLAAGRVTDKIRQRMEFKNMSDTQIAQSDKFKNLQNRAKSQLKTAQYFSNASFDVRQTGFGNLVSAQTGMNMGSVGMFSTQKTAGGYEGAITRKAEKERKFAESLGENHSHKTTIEKTIKEREQAISDKEDQQEFLRNEMEKLKQQHPKGSQPIKDQQDKINKVAEELRLLRKGEDTKWKQSDVGMTINPATGQTVTQAEVGTDKPHTTWNMADVQAKKKKADGQLVTENDVVNKVKNTQSMGLEEMKKALERNGKARARAYIHQQMTQSGYHVHGEEYDNLGNIKTMGHFDYSHNPEMRTWNMRAWGKAIGAAIKSGLVTSMTAGLTGAAFLGPVGAITGAITGGVLGMMRERAFKIGDWTIDPFDRKLTARASELSADLDHKIHTFKTYYKSPSSEFLKIFSELSESKGGGDDHGDHGHAGDHGH